MRGLVILAQGLVFNAYFLVYLVSPRTCHRCGAGGGGEGAGEAGKQATRGPLVVRACQLA